MIRKSRPLVFCKKGVLTNLRKFIRKHLHGSIAFNEVADIQYSTLSKKEILAQVFTYEFCENPQNTFLTECFCTTPFT